MLLQTVTFRGRLAAAASPDRYFLNAHVEALEDDHPDRLFVSFMCCYARDVMDGLLPGPYSDELAELYARHVLVPDEDFVFHQHLGDADLAERYGLPLDQVHSKRTDITRSFHAGRSDGRV